MEICLFYRCKKHNRNEVYCEPLFPPRYPLPKHRELKYILYKVIGNCDYKKRFLQMKRTKHLANLELDVDEFIKFTEKFLEFESPDTLLDVFENLTDETKNLIKQSLTAINENERFREYVDKIKKELLKSKL